MRAPLAIWLVALSTMVGVACSKNATAPISGPLQTEVIEDGVRLRPVSVAFLDAQIAGLVALRVSQSNFNDRRVSRSGRPIRSLADRLAAWQKIRQAVVGKRTSAYKLLNSGFETAGFENDSADASAALEARSITIEVYDLNPPTPPAPGDYGIIAAWSPSSPWDPWFFLDRVRFSVQGTVTSCTSSVDQHEIDDGFQLLHELDADELEEGSGDWSDEYTIGSHNHLSEVEAEFAVEATWKFLGIINRYADDDVADEWSQCDI